MGIKGGARAEILSSDADGGHQFAFHGRHPRVTAANNLLASLVDNHIYFGNELQIDLQNISWKRCVDLNDRALRKVELKIEKKSGDYSREDGFNISVASEIMAILCLSEISLISKKIGRIVIGLNIFGKTIFARQLNAEGLWPRF